MVRQQGRQIRMDVLDRQQCGVVVSVTCAVEHQYRVIAALFDLQVLTDGVVGVDGGDSVDIACGVLAVNAGLVAVEEVAQVNAVGLD